MITVNKNFNRKMFLVQSIQPLSIHTVDGFEIEIMARHNEGVFNTRDEAEERIAGMIEEKSKNDSEMYFEVSEVYTKFK